MLVELIHYAEGMNNTATTATIPLSTGSRIEIDEMTPGLYRVALWAATGQLVNRYRDVAEARVQNVVAMLTAEDGEK